MAATSLDLTGFASYLQSEQQEFITDLSKASMKEVLEKYQEFKRKLNPNFSISAIIYNISKLEFQFHVIIKPTQITDDFYAHLIQFMLSKGIKYSTIKLYCGTIKTALNWGVRHNCPVSQTYDQFEIPSYNKTKVSLTPDEISHIYHFNLKNKKMRANRRETLEKVRDQFVLGCMLYQRFSDMKRITPHCFNETRDVFTIIQQKTGNKAIVNLNTMTIDPKATHKILKKYNYYSPCYNMSINFFNKTLHELLQMIGEEFGEKVNFENKIAGAIETETKYKWQLISSHTCRRTAITNACLRGEHEAKVRQCSGHLDSKSFNKYIILDD